MVLDLASGPMALASKVQALALRAALTIFCHHHRTRGPTTTTKIVKSLPMKSSNVIANSAYLLLCTSFCCVNDVTVRSANIKNVGTYGLGTCGVGLEGPSLGLEG